ncbi:MAG: CoA pyrophosphatase [Thermogutta sp.]|nr:CoA pyrophosphatase [Thermogutta sp.]
MPEKFLPDAIHGTDFIRWLRTRLKSPLPGFSPEGRFSPRPVRGRNYAEPLAQPKPAAVLLLLYPREATWHIPFVVRPWTMPTHAGQIGLPGGALLPNEAPEVGALREYREELGADPEQVELLGSLTPIHVHSSGYRIDPWLGVAFQTPAFSIDTHEVAGLLEIPLAHLMDRRNFGSQQRTHRGETYESPAFSFENHQIWGATCAILGELILLAEEYLTQTGRPSLGE